MIQRADTKQIIKYLVSGGTAFVVDYGVFLIAFYKIQIAVVVSAILSFGVAFVVGFILQKQWTFKSDNQQKSLHNQLALNILLALFNLVVSTFMTKFLVDAGMLALIARPLIIAVIAIWNFIIYQNFIFK